MDAAELRRCVDELLGVKGWTSAQRTRLYAAVVRVVLEAEQASGQPFVEHAQTQLAAAAPQTVLATVKPRKNNGMMLNRIGNDATDAVGNNAFGTKGATFEIRVGGGKLSNVSFPFQWGPVFACRRWPLRIRESNRLQITADNVAAGAVDTSVVLAGYYFTLGARG